jgi:hypothetical protein
MRRLCIDSSCSYPGRSAQQAVWLPGEPECCLPHTVGAPQRSYPPPIATHSLSAASPVCTHNSPERGSFVDCLVMAYANLYDTREIFGFDAVFVQNGYHLPSKAEKQAA